LGDPLNIGEAYQTAHLGVFPGPFQDLVPVTEQGPFEKAKAAIVLEGINHDYVGPVVGVTGNPPFALFDQAALQYQAP